MQIIKININALTPFDKNAKLHPDWQIEQIKNSIEHFGMNDPIAVWGDNNIIVEGHGRLLALKQLGYTECDCIRLDHLTDEERKAYTLAHNKLTMNTDYDFDLLSDSLDEIFNIDMSDFGFEIDTDEKETEIVEDEVPEIDETEPPKSKLGDIYQLGRHRLMCGDSTDEKCVNALMNGNKGDMVFTDPPYGMNLDTDYSSMQSKMFEGKTGNADYKKVIGDNEDFKPELINTIFNNFAYCKEMFVWGADYFPELLEQYKNGNMIVWDKRANGNGNEEEDMSSDKMFGSCFELVWSKNKHKKDIVRIKWAGIFGLSGEDTSKRVHPTQKPIALCEWFINKYSKANDIIVDLYGGSGSTLIGCEQTDRICYMLEYSPHYIDVIIQRWENFTGQKAEKICNIYE